jgi:hypothetical protein
MNPIAADSRQFLRHTLATLAYRAGKCLKNPPNNFTKFRAGDSGRTAGEILAHLGDLLDWALTIVKGKQAWHDSAPRTWVLDVERFYGSLARLDEYLASDAPIECSLERLFQGPIADALSHVGQIAMLRRLALAPIRGENYYVAEIQIGRVGPEQAAPRREF